MTDRAARPSKRAKCPKPDAAPVTSQKHMPRHIATYSAAEWLRLRPLSHGYKTALWNRIDRRFVRQPAAETGQLEAVKAKLAGRNVIATIAWNSAWVIRWQLRFVAKNLRNAAFLVADNSTDPKARAEIAAVCAEAGVAYVGLPPNPYQASRHASRSHGLALNWVYRNIIRQIRPQAWGFFDHDLFPTKPYDPEQRLRGQLFYGDLEVREGGRYLWPGYCLFARGADERVTLDFRQDWFRRLDTGGMNAGLLFDKADFSRLTIGRRRSIGPQRNYAVTMDEIDWFDDCVHLGNASGWLGSTAERQAALDALLGRVLEGEFEPPAGFSFSA